MTHGQPHTPPWPEQQPRLSEQLKQLGERVPSQHRRPPLPGGGGLSLFWMRIVCVAVTLPHAPPEPRSVTVSVPMRVAL